MALNGDRRCHGNRVFEGNVNFSNTMADLNFNAKHAFLTYAQADALVSKENVLQLLQELLRPDAICVGQETHEDGGLHFHVLVRWNVRRHFRDPRAFDLEGVHPNVQSPRSWRRVIDYCIKDGVYINRGFDLENESIVDTTIRHLETGAAPSTIVTDVVKERGDKALKLITQIATFVDLAKKPGVVHKPLYNFPANFVLDPRHAPTFLNFTMDVTMPVGLREGRYSLWLYGPSRTGKTTFARSLGDHWYMNGSWNVECYSDNCPYGVLDDIEWERLRPYYKGLLGMQLDVTVTDKYKRKSVIRGGRPVIVITNELPDFSQAERAWLEANVLFLNIDYKMWRDGFAQQDEDVLRLVRDEVNNVFALPPSE